MNGSGNVHVNQSCVSRSTSLPTARHDVSPGDSMPDAWTIIGLLRSRAIMKSAKVRPTVSARSVDVTICGSQKGLMMPRSGRRAGSTNASTGSRSCS